MPVSRRPAVAYLARFRAEVLLAHQRAHAVEGELGYELRGFHRGVQPRWVEAHSNSCDGLRDRLHLLRGHLRAARHRRDPTRVAHDRGVEHRVAQVWAQTGSYMLTIPEAVIAVSVFALAALGFIVVYRLLAQKAS